MTTANAVPQHMDDVLGIYVQIVEETMSRSAGLQNPKVLEQVKQRWLDNLRARVAKRQQPLSAVAPTQPLGERVGQVDFKAVKIRVKQDAQSGAPHPVRTGDESRLPPDVVAEKQESRVKVRPEFVADPGAPDIWSGPTVWEAVAPAAEVTETGPTAPHWMERQEAQPFEPPQEATVLDEDGSVSWGSWHRPESDLSADEAESRMVGIAETQPTPYQATTHMPGYLGGDESPVEGMTDAEGTYVPREQDFATRITTQYGRTEGLGRVIEGGDASNAYNWDNPDEVDIDLDNVSDLSDVEPEARDLIIGQMDHVSRPPGRKVTSIGVWKVRVRNGIAKINGQEFFFDSLQAELDF